MQYFQKLNSQKKFEKEFTDIQKLGKGGFSKVFQATYKLDQQKYAIKVIEIHNRKKHQDLEERISKMLREVRILAKANNANVLRYYNSWLQIDMKQNKQDKNDSSYKQRSQQQINLAHKKVEDDYDFELIIIDDQDQDIYLNSPKSQNHKKSLEKIPIQQKHKLSMDLEQKPIMQQNQDFEIQNIQKLSLYICTEICQQTLYQYIEERNQKNYQTNEHVKDAFIIIEQIINGIQYIHQELQTVHRDIKPSNIFIFENLQIKIGDLGLIKPMLENLQDNSNEDSNDISNNNIPRRKLSNESIFSQQYSNSNSGSCGTYNYASPEQLSENKEKLIDYKSDIYSLAIIIFQLFYIMVTYMEININLEQTKDGIFPQEFQQKYPLIYILVKKMVNQNSNDRPSLQVINLQQKEVKIELEKIKLNMNNSIRNSQKIIIKFENDENLHERYYSIQKRFLYIFENQNQQKANLAMDLSQSLIILKEDKIILQNLILLDCEIMTQNSNDLQILHENLIQVTNY